MIKQHIVVICVWTCGIASAQSFKAQNFIVSGASSYMVQTAKHIIQKGGNIFDSAVASAFVLNVTTPYFVSLGCGGFALIKKNTNDIIALDFRETAPHKTTADFFTKNNLSSRIGGPAVATPGFVAGMWAIHKKYGKLPWSELLKPAIRLAKNGFVVSGDHFYRTKDKKNQFNLSGQRIFFHSDGSSYLPGEKLKQTKLSLALRLLSQKGRQAFYKGPIGKDVIRSVQNAKGVISKKDLYHYKVQWLTPIKWIFNGYQLHSMPLPSSGGIILARALRLTEHFKNRYNHVIPFQSTNEYHLFAEVLSLAFKPRFNMGAKSTLMTSKKDSDLTKWLSDSKLKKLASKISLHHTKLHHTKLSNAKLPNAKKSHPKPTPKETTHFSMMNNKGQAVSMTLTLNSNYGSFVVTNKYGIVLNNQMDDFNTRPGKANQFGLIQGSNNNVEAGKRPLSSMSPTIIEQNGRTVLVLGAAGGPMIISAVFQTLYHYLVHRLDLDLAVQAPRLHHQFLPNILYVDKNRFTPIGLNTLTRKGHKIRKRKIATVHAVGTLDTANKLLEGAFDARGAGATGGL